MIKSDIKRIATFEYRKIATLFSETHPRTTRTNTLKAKLNFNQANTENRKNINHAFFAFSEKSKNINFVKVVTNY